jgi:hypothetical protein
MPGMLSFSILFFDVFHMLIPKSKEVVVGDAAGMKPFGKGFAGLFLTVLQPICTRKWRRK